MYFYHHRFSFNGHRNAATIKDLNENDLLQIEEYSLRLPRILQRALELEKCINVNEKVDQMLEFFFAIYLNGVEFKFPPGDRKLIMLIGEMVRAKVLHVNDNGITTEDYSYFQLGLDYNNCQIVSTPIGNLYYDNKTDKNNRPNEMKSNAMVSNESTDRSSQIHRSNPDLDAIKNLVSLLKAGLEKKIGEFFLRNAAENLTAPPPEVIGVEFDSVVSQLENEKIIASNSCQPNDSRKSASAIIKCSCLNQTSTHTVKVFFVFKKPTRDIILSTLSVNSVQITQQELHKITVHFASCWSLSNFLAHKKRIQLSGKCIEMSSISCHIILRNIL